MNVGRVAAIVVTYNRAELLRGVIQSMKKQSRQPDALIVINNASNDNTLSIVESEKEDGILNIDLVNLPMNIGGAGGFYEGAKKAYQDGYDALWFMDDDTMPKVDALLHLESDLISFENKTGYKPAFICSTVLWKNDDLCEMNIPRPIWDWSRFIHLDSNVALVGSCSFVSVLVRRDKVAQAGLPVPEFFIWYDDVEYTQRLARYGYPGLLSFRSQVNHWLPENKGVNFELVNSANIWKYMYGIRNEAAVVLKNDGRLKYFIHLLSRFSMLRRLNIAFRHKIILFSSCLKALSFKYEIQYP